MLRIYEHFNAKEQQALDEMRTWAIAQGKPNEHLIGKLAIGQRVIDGGLLGPNDAWKMNAIGVLFGDALKDAMGDRLAWVIAEDTAGRSYALSWQHTEALIYPLSAIKSRLLAGEPVELRTLYDEYLAAFSAPRRI